MTIQELGVGSDVGSALQGSLNNAFPDQGTEQDVAGVRRGVATGGRRRLSGHGDTLIGVPESCGQFPLDLVSRTVEQGSGIGTLTGDVGGDFAQGEVAVSETEVCWIPDQEIKKRPQWLVKRG